MCDVEQLEPRSPGREPRDRRRRRSILLFVLLGAALVGAGGLVKGCAKPPGVIFPPPAHALVWPDPPESPRIRYVGQLASDRDLKPAVPFTQGLGRALFGPEPVQAMVTPFALCTDGGDRLFVADSGARLVHVFNLKTRQYTRWRGPKSAPLGQPVGIAFDNARQRVLVSDSLTARILAFDLSGNYLGDLAAGQIQRPCGLAIDTLRQRIYVADATAHQVVVLSPDGQIQARLGRHGGALGEFNYPTNVAIDSQGRLYVSDSLNFRVQQFGPDFRALRQIGQVGDLPGYFSRPKGLAIDREDHLYVVDAQFEAVQVFDPDGRLLLSFGEEGVNPGEFWLPAGIFIDPRNRIWVADCYNRRVQVFDYLPEGRP